MRVSDKLQFVDWVRQRQAKAYRTTAKPVGATALKPHQHPNDGNGSVDESVR
jgi:hypothetical protein